MSVRWMLLAPALAACATYGTVDEPGVEPTTFATYNAGLAHGAHRLGFWRDANDVLRLAWHFKRGGGERFVAG